MPADFLGSGLLGASGQEIYSDPDFAGTGVLVATPVGTLVITGVQVPLPGDGLFEAAGGDPLPPPEMVLLVLTPDLLEAPTTVTVALSEGAPDTEVVFQIDGTEVGHAVTDGLGALGSTAVEVPESVGTAGTHTITAIQAGSATGSGTFTLAQSTSLPPVVRAADTAPTAVAGSVQRWVLQDLMPGGLGSYVFPNNPSKMTSPHVQRTLNSEHTTAQSGQFHVFESVATPVRWQFSGYCGTQEFHDKLVAYSELNRRLYVIDHRGRAWTVAILDLDITARLRQTPRGGLPTDWGHDYTVTALIYDQKWVTPA